MIARAIQGRAVCDHQGHGDDLPIDPVHAEPLAKAVAIRFSNKNQGQGEEGKQRRAADYRFTDFVSVHPGRGGGRRGKGELTLPPFLDNLEPKLVIGVYIGRQMPEMSD